MHKRIIGLLVLIVLLAGTVSLANGDISVGGKITFGKYPQHMRSDMGNMQSSSLAEQ